MQRVWFLPLALLLASPLGCSDDTAGSGASSSGSADTSSSTGVSSSTATGSPATFSGTLSYAAFGDDGHTHVFAISDTGAITQLTTGPHDDVTPEWSFDGTRITFQRGDNDGIAVYVMNADGTGLTRLSPIPGRDLLPGFSPDGTQIVFNHIDSPDGCNGGAMPSTSILTMSAIDGSSRTTVVDGAVATTCFNVEPRFSPDGTKIAFMCGPSNGSVQICLADPDGSNITFLTTTSGTVAGDPHWSSDGQQLGISRLDTDGNVNVWTMNADGSDLVQVTTFIEPVEGGDVGWSLDDNQLVFEEDVGGMGQSVADAPAGISIIGADGEGYASLEVTCSGIGCAPRFRPHR